MLEFHGTWGSIIFYLCVSQRIYVQNAGWGLEEVDHGVVAILMESFS